MKKRTFFVLFFSLLFLSSVVLIAIFQPFSFHSDKKKEKENTLYATVLEKTETYVKVKPVSEEEEWLINTQEPLKKGDFILVTYFADEFKSITPNKIQVLMSSEEMEKTEKKKEEERTPKETTTKKNTETLSIETEEKLLENIQKKMDQVDESTKKLSAEAKEFVINLIDFIFYRGEIEGITFDQLRDTTKAKVVYYMLLLDRKIEESFPKYKETINKKVSSLKVKLMAKYISLTNTLCKEKEKTCEEVKKDFAILKEKMDISWENMKETFSYGVEKGTQELKNMYELWKE